MSPQEYFRIIVDLPLVGSECDYAKLFGAALSLRRQIDHYRYGLGHYAEPENAQLIYRGHLGDDFMMPRTRALGTIEGRELQAALAHIGEIMPEWHYAMSIPLAFRGIENCHAMTNRWMPQRIFLGETAFVDAIVLEEAIVHELAHIWCGFVMEVYEFQGAGCPASLTLPSGTSGKTLSGVILAAHFAAAVMTYLRRLYTVTPCERIARRLVELKQYLLGSIEISLSHSHRTAMGDLVVGRLAAFSSTV